MALAFLAFIVAMCLTTAVVAWGVGRLGLPLMETLAWFGLAEPRGAPAAAPSTIEEMANASVQPVSLGNS